MSKGQTGRTSKKSSATVPRPVRNPWIAPVLAMGLVISQGGCVELVHMGQLSDQEGAFSITHARIEQRQPDGSWKLLDKTDGHGRIWILKDKIQGGGRIRISKPGYSTLYMLENEFLQENNLLMIPDGGARWEEDFSRPGSDRSR